MEFKLKQKNNYLEMTINGELVAENIAEFNRSLKEGLSTDKNLVLLMPEVSYVCSAGLGVITGIHKAFEEKGGKLILASLNPTLFEIFKRTKLTSVLHIADNLEQAEKMIEG